DALGFTRENVGLQPFCLGGGFLFRTVVRAGGNPGFRFSEILRDYCNSKLLDSRLRGNDG
ncbi:MAG: hypothetical protein E7I68_06430, partial [Neisseria sp.]|nr:hypothetical protein [Neisseria sp.]